MPGQNEKHLRSIVEHSTNLFYVHDHDGIITYLSPQCKDFFGVEPDEAKQQWTEFLTDHPVNEARQKLTEQALATGVPPPLYELQLRRANGAIIWVMVNESPLIEDGEVVGMTGSLTDITARKEAREQLQRSLDRYKYVSRASYDAIWDSNLLEDVMYWGEGFETLFGHKAGNLAKNGQAWLERVHPEDRERVTDSTYNAIGGNGNYWIDTYRFQRGDGSWAQVEDRGYVLRTEDGNAVRMIGAMKDITEQLETERRLRNINEKLNIAQRIARLGYWEESLESGELYWSEEVYRIFGRDPEKFRPDSNTFKEAVHPEDLPSFATHLKRALKGRTKHDVEYRIVLPDGSIKWVHEIGSLKRDSEGKPDRFEGTVQDITSRKESEELIAASLREKEILLAEIHHRVKNNLALVSSLMELQAMNSENGELNDRLLEGVLRIKSIAGIHEQLYRSRTFSRIRISDELRSLVNSIVSTLQSGQNLKLQYDLDEVEISINQGIPFSLLINEVVTNIIKHAYRGRDSGSVDIRLKEEGGKVFFEIEDDGIGLPEEFGGMTKSSMGLRLIDLLTRQLGAEKRHESTGSGTLFTIRFEKLERKEIGGSLGR